MSKLSRRAHQLAIQENYREARALVQAAIEEDPGDVSAWLLLSKIGFLTADFASAHVAARRVIELGPELAEGHYTLGRIHKARGENELAVQCYRLALERDPRNAEFLISMGVALRAGGRIDQAMDTYREALRIAPGNTIACNNLANALQQCGKPAFARVCRDLGPGALTQVEQCLSRSAALKSSGQFRESLDAALAGLAIASDSAELLILAATAAAALGSSHQSLHYFDRLLEAAPWARDGLYHAFSLAAVSGLPGHAERYGAAILRSESDSDCIAVLRRATGFAVPAISASRESIRETRSRYESAVDALMSERVTVSNPSLMQALQPFYLAYHGENDRDLQVKSAKLHIQAIPSLCYVAPHCELPRRPSRRIRVGLISRFLFQHSIGKTTRGLVDQLDRTKFEVFVIRITPGRDDQVTASIRMAADHYVEVPSEFPPIGARLQIAALELDVLFYQDIGMESMSYLLSFSRLAHVQCVSFGHPITTGVPAMDYFVSNDLYETEESAAHYSESLFLLHNLPTLAYYYEPTPASGPRQRAEFGLPERGALYLCPQSSFKLHPDFDELLRGILERDSLGHILLISGKFPQWRAELEARFRQTLGESYERVLWLDRMDGGAFLNLLAIGDVMLDPVHFNGMNTSLEAFSVELPVVTLPGAFQRARHTAAMYMKMGISDFVASDASSYVDIAVRLGTDRGLNLDARARLRIAKNVLYQDSRVVREFERFFETAMAARGLLN